MELEYARANPTSRWKFPSTVLPPRLPAGAEKPLVTLLLLDSCRDQQGRHNWEAQTQWLREHWAIRITATGSSALRTIRSTATVTTATTACSTPWGPLFAQHTWIVHLCVQTTTCNTSRCPACRRASSCRRRAALRRARCATIAEAHFSRSVYGFADLHITPHRIRVKFINRDGDIAHSFRNGRVPARSACPQGDQDQAVPRHGEIDQPA